MELYRAEVVRRVCPGVSLRMLDYWVLRKIIEPSHFVEGRGRRIYLFDFTAILQVRMVKSLRDAGVSLKTIGLTIQHLKKARGKTWHSAWLLTDGREVFEHTEAIGVIQALGKEPGQLAFAAIAIGPAESQVRQKLRRYPAEDTSRYEGKVRRWRRGVAIPA